MSSDLRSVEITEAGMDTYRDQVATVPTVRRRRLSWRYRAGWRFTYVMLNAYGPAQLGGNGQPDPRALMRRDRAERVRALEVQRPTAAPGAPLAITSG
jgi:hypothetical protein